MTTRTPPTPRSRARDPGKLVSAADAVSLIRDGDTVATSGFVGIGFAENIAVALEQRFLASETRACQPRDLTLVYAAGQGDGKDRGLNHFGHPGLLKRIVGGHWGLVPKLRRWRSPTRIEAYNLPQGVISHLLRDIAAGKPGHLTRVGLGTFVDPRHGGGKINERTTEDLVELMTVGGEELPVLQGLPDRCRARPRHHRRPRRQHHDGARGADARGAGDRDGGAQLAAASSSRRSSASPSAARCNPRQVKIPGVLVDCVVVADSPSTTCRPSRAVQRRLQRRDARADAAR